MYTVQSRYVHVLTSLDGIMQNLAEGGKIGSCSETFPKRMLSWIQQIFVLNEVGKSSIHHTFSNFTKRSSWVK